jgi:hypothetical protein
MILKNRDIQNITGMTRRTAQRLARKVRKAYNKGSNDFITIYEFCEFYKFSEDKVRECIQD